jgi:hypothetical protein
MASPDDPIHLGLLVEPAGLEVFDQPLQDDKPLFVLHRDGGQPSGRIDEVL